jgi:transcriptional regulator with XRE-family HTH domain
MLDKIFFAKNLKTIRGKWKLSQEEFGDLFKMNRSKISNIEQVKQYPSVVSAYKISLATDIPMMELLCREVKIEELPDQPGRNSYKSPLDKIEERLLSIEKMIKELSDNR